MTQNLAQCSNCHGMVMHLEATAVVERCDRCKGKQRAADDGLPWAAPHLQDQPAEEIEE